MTAASVTSEPVPAVVGTARRSGSFLWILSIPLIFPTGRSLFTARAPATLAQSMTEPPPMARIASQPDTKKHSAAASTSATVGSGDTPVYSTVRMPASSHCARSGAIVPRRIVPGVVMTCTAFIPCAFNNSGILVIHPSPCTSVCLPAGNRESIPAQSA